MSISDAGARVTVEPNVILVRVVASGGFAADGRELFVGVSDTTIDRIDTRTFERQALPGRGRRGACRGDVLGAAGSTVKQMSRR